MLTITDFINILHRYYKSPMVCDVYFLYIYFVYVSVRASSSAVFLLHRVQYWCSVRTFRAVSVRLFMRSINTALQSGAFPRF